MLTQIKTCENFLKNLNITNPEVGIILGSGLGKFAEKIEIKIKIPFSEIPYFPVSTVEGHSGNLIFGSIHEKNVLALQGRFHYYEGYSLAQTTFPIRVLGKLGVKKLFVSNASGGVNSSFNIGDLMIIEDHIHLFPDNPLRGKNINELGPRFPDMSEPYCKKLIDEAEKIALKNNMAIKKGVYLGWQGPTYETPAEYAMVNAIGADAVGMSTTPEVIIARHMNIPVFGISIITDLGIKGKIVEVSHEEVQLAAAKAEPAMSLLFEELIKKTCVS